MNLEISPGIYSGFNGNYAKQFPVIYVAVHLSRNTCRDFSNMFLKIFAEIKSEIYPQIIEISYAEKERKCVREFIKKISNA